MDIPGIILFILAIYLASGFVFAIPFVLKGVSRIDESAEGATWGFRLIIMPGTIIFWPLLLKRWINAAKKKMP